MTWSQFIEGLSHVHNVVHEGVAAAVAATPAVHKAVHDGVVAAAPVVHKAVHDGVIAAAPTVGAVAATIIKASPVIMTVMPSSAPVMGPVARLLELLWLSLSL